MTLQNKTIALSDDAPHRNMAQPNHALNRRAGRLRIWRSLVLTWGLQGHHTLLTLMVSVRQQYLRVLPEMTALIILSISFTTALIGIIQNNKSTSEQRSFYGMTRIGIILLSLATIGFIFSAGKQVVDSREAARIREKADASGKTLQAVNAKIDYLIKNTKDPDLLKGLEGIRDRIEITALRSRESRINLSDFSRSLFNKGNFWQCFFRDGNFKDAAFDGSTFNGSRFPGTSFINARFQGASMGNADFSSVDLSQIIKF
jgi:hypothetical protein